MNLVKFDSNTAKALLESKEEFPIDFDNAWQWLGYSRKDHALEAFKNCGFIEGIDFSRIVGKTSVGGRPSHSYRLTLDCLKQFGQMAGTEMGKKVRLYFIEAEKTLKQVISQQTDLSKASKLDVLKQLQEATALAIESEQKVQALLPKADGYERIIANDDEEYSVGVVAGLLKVPRPDGKRGYMGRNLFMKTLRDLEIMQKQVVNGASVNRPYQKYINAGYFKIMRSADSGDWSDCTYVTKKGLDWLKNKLHESGYLQYQIS